jgi:hypothetical protein
MDEDIRVAVPFQAKMKADFHAAQNQRASRDKSVDVVAFPHPQLETQRCFLFILTG